MLTSYQSENTWTNGCNAVTVKELKEQLAEFPDDLIVVIPSGDWGTLEGDWYTPAKNISKGVNECDGLLLIDDYEEDE